MEIRKDFIQQIQSIITTAKERAIHSVDTERVLMYWQIGKVIFEEEQQGRERAVYGEFLIKTLSKTLQPQFGSGFSIRQLEMCRQFYRSFPIANALCSQFSWTHYRILIRINTQNKNDAVVKITLPENNKTIFASKYQLYLPTEQQLIDELKKEIEKLETSEI